MTHVTAGAPRPPDAVGPLVRGLAVLRALTAAGGGRSAGDLARDTGLARSTIDRVLDTLERLRHLRLEGRDARLTPRVMELGNAYLAACRFPDLLGPLAARLADELDESVSLAVPDRDGVRLVHQVTRRRPMSVALQAGDLLPAQTCAPGALFAADWSEDDWRRWRSGADADSGGPARVGDTGPFEERAAAARRDGWAADDQLIEPGLVAVAMPVRDAGGRRVCAAYVVSHTNRHDAAGSLCAVALDRLRETTTAMERALSSEPSRAEPASARPARPELAASRMRAAKHELGPGFVESLARGICLVTAFGDGPDALSLTAASGATGLPRATVRRSLITLAHLGYAAAAGRQFRLTPRVLDLGFACLSGLTMREIAEPHLASLVERVHDSASMAILVGDDIQYIARVPTVRIMSVDITLGTRFPAYATSMGRVLLGALSPAERTARLRRTELRPLTRHTATSPERLGALLEQANRDGFVEVNGELEEGLRSIAVPVRNHGGTVVAAINVSMHAGRRTAREARESVLPHLREAARRIEADLHVAGRYVELRAT